MPMTTQPYQATEERKHLTTGGPGKEQGTNKLPATRILQRSTRGQQEMGDCSPEVLATSSEQQRPSKLALPPAATRASPSTTGSRRRERQPAAVHGRAAVALRSVLAAPPGLTSAVANAAALANRSAGSFSSAVSTASSTCAGTVCRCGVSARGVSVRTRATIAWAVDPVNGGSPVSI